MGLAERPWVRKSLVTMASRKHRARFDRASRDMRATQDGILRRIIESCRDTVYGRDHSFAKIKTLADYRAAVAIGDFESHRPYIDRMMLGEADVLFPGKPIIYNTTSGTTDKPKMIPVSKEYFDESISSMNKVWLHSVMQTNPRIYDGRSLSAVAPAVDGHVADGTPYGSVSGLAYQNIPAVLKSTHSCPYAVLCIRDYDLKYYAMIRHALEYSITYIISPSPSNILRFTQTAIDNAEAIVRDINDGTLKAEVVEQIAAQDRAAVLGALKPQRARAKELERLFAQHGSSIRPRHFWPALACVNVWKEGNFRLILAKLDGYFPEQTVVRSFGYQASEARAGLVLEDSWDYSVAAAHVYHFEFMEEAERGSGSPRTLEAHEVETGKRYHLLFSNGSGLYRYDINDIVEIVGWYNQFPLFRFIQKGEGVTSLTGEKLAEPQVIQAVSECAKESGTGVEFYLMFCDEVEMTYRFFVEFAAGVTQERMRAFAAAVDRKLQAFNPEYEIKRNSARLAPPRLTPLRAGSQETLKRELVGRRLTTDGQYKELYLTRKRVAAEVLQSLALESAGT